MNYLLQRLIQIEMVMESLMCGPQEPGHGGTGKRTLNYYLMTHFSRTWQYYANKLGDTCILVSRK